MCLDRLVPIRLRVRLAPAMDTRVGLDLDEQPVLPDTGMHDERLHVCDGNHATSPPRMTKSRPCAGRIPPGGITRQHTCAFVSGEIFRAISGSVHTRFRHRRNTTCDETGRTVATVERKDAAPTCHTPQSSTVSGSSFLCLFLPPPLPHWRRLPSPASLFAVWRSYGRGVVRAVPVPPMPGTTGASSRSASTCTRSLAPLSMRASSWRVIAVTLSI